MSYEHLPFGMYTVEFKGEHSPGCKRVHDMGFSMKQKDFIKKQMTTEYKLSSGLNSEPDRAILQKQLSIA